MRANGSKRPRVHISHARVAGTPEEANVLRILLSEKKNYAPCPRPKVFH